MAQGQRAPASASSVVQARPAGAGFRAQSPTRRARSKTFPLPRSRAFSSPAMVQAHLLVGTFNTPAIFTLAFDADARSLTVVEKNDATGSHSWLSLSVRPPHLALQVVH